jgi:hypothetical protein
MLCYIVTCNKYNSGLEESRPDDDSDVWDVAGLADCIPGSWTMLRYGIHVCMYAYMHVYTVCIYMPDDHDVCVVAGLHDVHITMPRYMNICIVT